MAPDAYEEFTDRQRTRVVRRDALDERGNAETSIGATQAFSKKKEGLFDGLSIAQIIAGAAAAATSVVLASKIGITGSVIGAAVSSVVTVVSSQLYRHFLTASAEKLKNGRDALGTPAVTGRRNGRAGDMAPATTTRIADERYRTSTATSVMGAGAHAGAQNEKVSVNSRTRIAPERLQAKAEAERSATQRKVIGFSIVAAVVALVACVAVILALTAGEGLGTKTTPIFAPATEEEQVTDTAASDNGATSSQGGHSASTEQGMSGQGASNSNGTSAGNGASSSGTANDGNTSTDSDASQSQGGDTPTQPENPATGTDSDAQTGTDSSSNGSATGGTSADSSSSSSSSSSTGAAASSTGSVSAAR